jgi:hypothetical protein
VADHAAGDAGLEHHGYGLGLDLAGVQAAHDYSKF